MGQQRVREMMIPGDIERLLAQLQRDGQAAWARLAPIEPMAPLQLSPSKTRELLKKLWIQGQLSDRHCHPPNPLGWTPEARAGSQLWPVRVRLQQSLGLSDEAFDWSWDAHGLNVWYDRHAKGDE